LQTIDALGKNTLQTIEAFSKNSSQIMDGLIEIAELSVCKQE
jgi:hypothetical protein